MLLIPELKSVVIQPPRTGTSAFRDAILKRYPNAISIYRHMERPGIPRGYEAWSVYCMIRDPFERLASLYSYMGNFRPTSKIEDGPHPDWVARMSGDVARPFADWLEESSEVFTDPNDPTGAFLPYYNITEPTAAVRKSQFRWARPDMGAVTLFSIEDTKRVSEFFDVAPKPMNAAIKRIRPARCARVEAHLRAWHAWDLEVAGEVEAA